MTSAMIEGLLLLNKATKRSAVVQRLACVESERLSVPRVLRLNHIRLIDCDATGIAIYL